jgi:hypothetical protein
LLVNVLPFIKTNTKGLVHVVQTFGVGLVKSRDDHISAVSPDAVCVFECSNVGLAANDESKLVRDVRQLCSFLSTTNGLVERKDENDDGDLFCFMAIMEYKHKSGDRRPAGGKENCVAGVENNNAIS